MNGTKAVIQMLALRAEIIRDRDNNDVLGRTDFMDGMIRGITDSAALVKALVAEDLKKPTQIPRFKSMLILRSVKAALNRIRNGNRKDAIGILERLIVGVEGSE